MDPRDNRGKAKQPETSRKRRWSSLDQGTVNLVAANNNDNNDMHAQFARSQHQHLGTTSSLSTLLNMDMQFVQQYQMPLSIDSVGFMSHMTAPFGFNYMQNIPNHYVYENNIDYDVGGYRNYQQQPCNNSGSLVHLAAGTSMNNAARGPLLQPIVPTVTVEDYMDNMFLDDRYQEVQSWVENIRQSWSSTGCTIILDGWDDEITNRTMMDVFADNPLGNVYLNTYDVSFPSVEDRVPLIEGVIEDVIQKVRPENVIQVISYTTSSLLKEVSRRIEARHQSMYWNISATYCLAMMLHEVASSLTWVRKTIEQAKTITRLVHSNTLLLDLLKTRTGKNEDYYLVRCAKVKEATPFMTLENLLLNKNDLITIFASQVWKDSCVGSSVSGKKVAKVVSNKLFWHKVSLIVKGGMPIVNVIKLINDENGPLMGLIYETIDQLKETIKEQIGKKEAKPFWKIIDNIWDNLLHSPLHAAGYYLNPSLFYAQDFAADFEVMKGLMDTIVKYGSPNTQDKITQQLKSYEQADKDFARGVDEINNFSPVEWWRQFGGDCQELQMFAIKVLGLSCNGASCYELRRHDAEQLPTMNGIIPADERLMKERFVSYNSYLRELRQSKMKFNMVAPEINPNDNWIIGNY